MAKYNNHRKLTVWNKAMAFVKCLYDITKKFPQSELYTLTSQIQRAAISIPANIAEGCGRDSDNEFARYLHISMGSAYEIDTHVEIAYLNGYINEEEKDSLIKSNQEIMKMIYGILKTLK